MTPEELQEAIHKKIDTRIKEYFSRNKTMKDHEVCSIIKQVLNSYSEHLEPDLRHISFTDKGTIRFNVNSIDTMKSLFNNMKQFDEEDK